MNKRIKFLKSTFRALLASTLIITILFVMSCNNSDDPKPELYDISGVYTFKTATLQTEITIPGIPIPISKGLDITDELEGGLLAEAPCDNPENGAIELKSNNELFFVCIGEENELKAGTWGINSDTTELSLNLAMPPLPSALQLKISNLVINESTDVIGGTISNFPLNKSLIAGFLAGLPEVQRDAILAGIDDNYVVLIDVDIEFQKVSN